MGFVNTLLAAVPTVTNNDWGWLGWILKFIQGGVINAAWTMVIFTIIIKLVTFPLDFYSRYKMKKNAVIMEELKPQLEKLQKACKGDKTLYNQRMYPLLKKEGYSTFGACLPTLVTLALFIFIFSGLNTYATARNAQDYNEMVAVYNEYTQPSEDGDAPIYDISDPDDKAELDKILVDKYDSLNPGWLWVKNPWRPDISYTDGFFNFVANAKPIPSYDEFKNGRYGIKKMTIEDNTDAATGRENYNLVMGAVTEAKGDNNGYYILIVLAVGISFLSQFVMQKQQKTQTDLSGGAMGGSTMKMMMYIFPILMGVFAFSYTAVFTLYIITNSLFTLLSTLLINIIVNARLRKLKERKLAQISYRRR